MGTLTDWRELLRKKLEANLHRTSRAVDEGQWVFDPAIVTVTGDAATVFVTVTRALEFDRPELTKQRFECRYNASDDVEAAAREVADFIRTLH